jgi:hypothetical protein
MSLINLYFFFLSGYATTLPVSTLCSIEWRVIDEWWIGKDLEWSGRGLIEVLSGHLPGGTEENY